MGTCLGCDAQLVKRQVKYCSIRCQQAVIRSRRLADWLATGKEIHASKRGHYIRRENLRLICPNCCQLPTFKSRNRGRGRAWRKQRYADGLSY